MNHPLLLIGALVGLLILGAPMTAGCNQGADDKSGGSKLIGGTNSTGAAAKSSGATANSTGAAANKASGRSGGSAETRENKIPPAPPAPNIKVTSVKGHAALTIRVSVPMKKVSAALKRIFIKVNKHLVKMKIEAAGDPFMLIPRLPKSAGGTISLEAGYPVPKGTTGKGDIKATRRPGGKVARLSYRGDTKKAMKAHHDMAVWMRNNKVTPTGRTWEVYHNVKVAQPNKKISATIYYSVK